VADQPFAHLISAAAVVSAAFGACPAPFTTKLAPGKTWKDASVFWVDEMQTKKGTETQVFYFKDNGIGIEAEFHEEIFHIFKRLNEEDDDKKRTGAWLTFVRKVV
jgi:light-regulated signal transduction histidine kinase (bacteriophytochrome)